jgi:pimeloyl-ACP methyl ester carboxylesterase
LLASAGYRIIVPYLRGYGTSRFLSTETFRNGQQSVVALDTIALMDALQIGKAILGGFDWGARTADIIAALWPERCTALVSVSGYLIGSQKAGEVPLPPQTELQWWYQYYFATERGRAGYDKYRHDFAKLIWQLASPAAVSWLVVGWLAAACWDIELPWLANAIMQRNRIKPISDTPAAKAVILAICLRS